MTVILEAKRKVLVLAPSLQSVGGIQNYTSTLFDALQVVLGGDRVRMVAVPGDPELQDNGSLALPPSTKLRFLASALHAAARSNRKEAYRLLFGTGILLPI